MLKIKVAKLQEMLARASKGAANNKYLPLTNLLAVELKDSKLTITSTDGTNYLYVKEDVAGDDFYVCISADTFPKLIARFTCEDVTLDLKENYLEVVGNGKYKIDYQLDENGQMVKFPNPISDDINNKVGTISLNTIKSVLSSVRPSLANDNTQYASYYVGKSITATDTFKISSMAVGVFEIPKLIDSQTMDLLGTMIDENIDIYTNNDKKIMFTGDYGVVFGYTPSDIGTYRIDAILGLVNKDYPSKCKIAKNEILQVLDRISLFVDSLLDNDIINIAFENDGLSITSNKLNGAEKIPYITQENFKECSGTILLDRFATQIKAQSGDAVEIHFGDESTIKMVDNNISMIVALGAD